MIVEGSSAPSDPITGDVGERQSQAFSDNYASAGYSPQPDAWSDEVAGGLCVLTPAKALAWTDFPADVTRFTFGG